MLNKKTLSIQRTIHVLDEEKQLTFNEWMEYIIRERQKLERNGLIEIEQQIEKVLKNEDALIPESHFKEIIKLLER